MPVDVGQKAFIAGALVAGVITCFYLPWYLNLIKKLTATEEPTINEPPKPKPRQIAEDSISVKTIEDLYHGSSYEIRSCAVKLAANRLLCSPSAINNLLVDLQDTSSYRREQAINGLDVLLTHPALKHNENLSKLVELSTFRSITNALIRMLPEHMKIPELDSAWTMSPVKPPARPAHEYTLINILIILLEDARIHRINHVDHMLVDCGLISDWLAHYPFPCGLPVNRRRNFKRHDVVGLLQKKSYEDDDPFMAALVRHIVSFDILVRELETAGLKLPESESQAFVQKGWDNIHIDQSWIVGAHDVDEIRPLQARQRDDPGLSADERARRRQHRHAVVVAGVNDLLGPTSILQQLEEHTRSPESQVAEVSYEDV